MFENIGFGSAAPGDSDYDRGVSVMEQFRSAMGMYPSFAASIDDLIAFYKPGNIEGLGLAANTAGQSIWTPTAPMSDSATKTAMVKLAQAGGGKVPPTINDFQNALLGQAIQTSLWQEAKYVVGASAGDIVTGLQHVGNTAIDAGGIALRTLDYSKYLIYLLPAVALWWVVTNRSALSQTALQAVQKKVSGNPRRRRSRR